ncbi:MAG: type II secretion system protein [Chloroflexi bacterium]|nr:type II secretion system protein [Chloroflexota bacterium]
MMVRVDIRRWLAKARPRFLREQSGISLLEILIALGILAAIGVAFLSGLNTNSKAAGTLDEQVVATNLATAYLENIRQSTYAATYPNAGDNITVPFQYNVAINTAFSTDGTTWVGPYANQTLQKITIIISRQGRLVLSVCTFKMER